MVFRLRLSDINQMAKDQGLVLKSMNGVHIVGIPLGGSGAYRGVLEGSLRECWAYLRGYEDRGLR